MPGLLSGMNNPLTHMGLGILRANEKRMAYDPADLPRSGIASGLLGGMDTYNKYAAQQAEQASRDAITQARRDEIALKQNEANIAAQERRKMQQAIAQLPEPYRSAAMAGPKAAQEAIKAYLESKGGSGAFAGTGMDAQTSNFIVQDKVRKFKLQNPNATPEQVEAFRQQYIVGLSERHAMTPKYGGRDAITGESFSIPRTPLPALLSGQMPGAQAAPQATPRPVQAPAPSGLLPTPAGQTVPGMTAPSSPQADNSIEAMARRYRPGQQISDVDLEALNERPGTRMHFVRSAGGVMTLSKPERPPLPPTDLGKLFVQEADILRLPDGPEKTRRLQLVRQKIESTSMGAEAKRALDKMAIAGAAVDFFNEVADAAEGDTGNWNGRVTEWKMDKSSGMGAFIRVFSDQTSSEAALASMAATMRTQLGTALSGAAIPKDEWPNYESQLPQITDSRPARYAKAATYKALMSTAKRIAAGDKSEASIERGKQELRKILLDAVKAEKSQGADNPMRNKSSDELQRILRGG